MPAWLDIYQKKLCTAEEAVKTIKSGQTVYVHPGCCNPETLLRALVARAPELENVEMIHILTFGYADYVKPEMAGHFHHTAFFIGPNVREAVNDGRAGYVPIFLGEIPHLFYSGQVPIDVALLHLSPPDEHGFCSFGIGVDQTLAAARMSKTVVAQVNPHMPRVHGDNFIHVSKLDYIVEVDEPLPEMKPAQIDEVAHAIGRNVAGLIEDGACMQLGIGAIPDAVLNALRDRRDLGVHTEMFSDGAVELIDSGVITGTKKTLHPGKIIAGFVLGTHKLFEYMHDNPIIEFHPQDYVNDPFVIAQNDYQCAVNSAIQVDLTGQVVSDSIGYDFYSGIGGQVDFIRGAAHSKGGKPVIALPATARKGTVSRIATHINEGSGVVTSRGDVHYVATEFGVAYLHGKSISERAKALINIAAPQFRDELTEFAKEKRFI